MMKFAIDQRVRWISSNTRKTGVVVSIVPPHRVPADIGYAGVGFGSMSRSHESYIVRGAQDGGRQTNYWPVVTLLQDFDGLTPADLAWCHENAVKVRDLIAATAKQP